MGHVNRIYLALGTNQYLCLVKTVMKMWGNSCLAEDLLVSEERKCCLESVN